MGTLTKTEHDGRQDRMDASNNTKAGLTRDDLNRDTSHTPARRSVLNYQINRFLEACPG